MFVDITTRRPLTLLKHTPIGKGKRLHLIYQGTGLERQWDLLMEGSATPRKDGEDPQGGSKDYNDI